jgi:F0F1-type ATP synthase membrane subunit b/b'
MNRSMKRLLTVAFALCAPALALADEAAEHGGHGEHGWDTTAITASLVNFVLLIVLFTYLFKDKLSAFLIERRATVERELQEAARLKAEAEVKRKEYTERLAKLDQELATIKEEMIAAGKKERDRIIADAEHKASLMRKDAEFIIEQQAKQLRADLARDAADAAVQGAEQLLLRATTTYDQQRLAQEYLAALTANLQEKAPKKAAPKQPESRA